MKRQLSALTLSLLLLLGLTGCGPELQGSAGIDVGTSGSLIDLPVAGPEDGSQAGSLPDGSQGNEAEGNRPDGKSSEGNGSVDEDGWIRINHLLQAGCPITAL